MSDKLAKIEISFDGTTYTDVTEYVRQATYKGILNNQADTLEVKLIKTVEDTYTLREYLKIRYSEGWTTSTDRRPFKGLITRIIRQYDYVILNCADDIYKLLTSEKTAVYNDTDPQAGKLSAIAEDMMDEVIPTNVEDSGTDILLNQFVTSYKTNILERACVLAKALDWIILFDAEAGTDGEAYFVSKGYFTNSRVLTLPNDITERPKWDSDSTQLFNDLKYIGGTSSGQRTSLEDGDGSTLEFSVDLTPTDSVLVEEYIGGNWIEQVQGLEGVSATYDYSIDKANKKIIYKAGNAPASGTGNVRITISAQIPPIVHLKNDSSITLYNVGTDADGNLIGVKKTIIEDDIKSNEDALVRARKLLEIYAYPFLTTTITLRADVDKVANYKLGDKVLVTDSTQGFIQREFIITEIERTYPGAGAKITLGDKLYKLGSDTSNIKTRLAKLEGNLAGDYEVLADFRDINHDFKMRRKHIKVSVNSVAGNNLIWDHPVYGNWDEQNWAPDSSAATSGFILGHSIYGVLGTSKLGAGTDNEVIIDDLDYY